MRILLALLLCAGSSPQEGGAVVKGKVTVEAGARRKAVVTKYTGPGLNLRKDPSPSPAVVWLEGVAGGKAEPRTAELKQEGLEFRPRVAAVTAGSTVNFPNGDDLFHNVFSLSPARKFDLGKFPQGESKGEVFKSKCRVDVRCKVHEHMRGFIHVFDHPYFAVAGDDGAFSIPAVPPGKYALVVWKEDFEELRREVEVTAQGATLDLRIVSAQEMPAATALAAGCCPPR